MAIKVFLTFAVMKLVLHCRLLFVTLLAENLAGLISPSSDTGPSHPCPCSAHLDPVGA